MSHSRSSSSVARLILSCTTVPGISTRLAELLALRDGDPDAFAQLLSANWRQVKNWER
jgi:hypothetical protein